MLDKRAPKVLMMKKLQIVFMMLAFTSCTNKKISVEDFFGVWRSDDGAVLTLTEEMEFSAKNVILFNESGQKTKKVDFSGKWQFVEREKGNGQILLGGNSNYSEHGIYKNHKVNGKAFENKLELTLDIERGGFFHNSTPTALYIWIGDPDDLNMYKFLRN